MKNFPSSKEVAKINKKLEKVEGTKAHPKDASPLENFRHALQQKFVVYIVKHNCTQKALAEKLEIDEAKMSKILHNRLEEFSTDRLITLCQKINPKLKLAVG